MTPVRAWSAAGRARKADIVASSAMEIWSVAFVIVTPPACAGLTLVTRAALYWYWREYPGLRGACRRSPGSGPATQVEAGAPRSRRCWLARREPQAHCRSAPRGGRTAREPLHHLLHVSRTGTSGATIGSGAGRSGIRAADVRR